MDGGVAARAAGTAAPKMPEIKEKLATIDTNDFIDKLHARRVEKEIAADSRQFRRAALLPERHLPILAKIAIPARLSA